MLSNPITITGNGITQSLQAWGFTNLRMKLVSRAAGVVFLDTAGGDPSLPALFAYDAPITVQIGMGDGSTFTWVGKRRKFNGRAHPEARSTEMQFEDVWSDLLLTTFQHYWSMANGAGGLVNKYFSVLNLFQDISAGPDSAWVYLTADNQIRQIIEFAASNCGVPVQCGEVDPVWNMPIFQVKAISCAEAVELCLKAMPDTVTQIDGSTIPPTINFKQRANCAPVTLPYAGTDAFGRHHKQSDITPRPDLQVPSVNIQYWISGTYDGASYDDQQNDNYPVGSTGLMSGALVFPCNLKGPSNTTLKATLKTVAIDPTTPDFWKIVKADLNDPNIVHQTGSDGSGLGAQGFDILDTTINASSGHPDGISIINGAGGFVNLSGESQFYPNKLLPSGAPVANWMTGAGDGETGGGVVPIEGIPVTIRATLKYNVIVPSISGQKVRQVDRQVVETRVTLTNAPAGATPYSTQGSVETGDPLPTGLAYFIWCSVNNVPINWVGGIATPPATAPSLDAPSNLQWEGTHETVEQSIYSIITPANVLNLIGGNPDWEVMAAQIYQVDYDFFASRTTIHFGPHKHLTAAEYKEMVMAFRYRTIWTNPNVRNNGAGGASGAQDVASGGMPKENTTHQVPQQSVGTVISAPNESGSIVLAQHDANTNGGQIVVQTVKSDGTQDPEQPQVLLSQSDLGINLETGGRVAKWRLFACCASDGTPMQAMFASSAPEDLT